MEAALSEEAVKTNYRDIAELVRINYDELVSPDVMSKIMTFLQDKDSLAEYNPFFIKRVAKVLDRLAEKYPEEMESMAERMYKFNVECAGKIFSDKNSKVKDIRMGAHASSHASSIADRIYEETKDLDWKLRALSRRYISAQITKDSDKKYSSVAFYNVAIIANQLFSATGKIHFLDIAYNAYENAAELSKNDNLAFSAKMHGCAGYSACMLFYKSGGEKRLAYAEHALRPYSLFKRYFDANPDKLDKNTESKYKTFNSETALVTKIICEPKKCQF